MVSENFAKFCEVWDREQPVPEDRYRFFEIMNCVMIFFLTPEDVKNINDFFRRNGSFDEKRPVHEEIVVDEIHYNGNYMIKIGE
ncbi:hypothetical protein [Fusobacterium varium]|jgi:hypothetical protein